MKHEILELDNDKCARTKNDFSRVGGDCWRVRRSEKQKIIFIFVRRSDKYAICKPTKITVNYSDPGKRV